MIHEQEIIDLNIAEFFIFSLGFITLMNNGKLFHKLCLFNPGIRQNSKDYFFPTELTDIKKQF